MHLSPILIAEHITRYEGTGRYDLKGVHRSTTADAFPAQKGLVLNLEWATDAADMRGGHRITIHVLREDGSELVVLTGTGLNLSPEELGSIAAHVHTPVPIQIKFPAPGRYRFEVRHDGVTWGWADYVVKASR